MTARGHDPSKRREARRLAQAERLKLERRNVSLKQAARMLRDDYLRAAKVVRDGTPLAEVEAGIRADVRKALHDVRGKAVRS